jgi:hypothetical protein
MDMSSTASSSSDSMVPTSTMMMTFFTSSTTPLYSSMWMPSNIAQYAGTCLFLIVLATIFRSLLALRAIRERKWLDAELNVRYVVVSGKMHLKEKVLHSSDSNQMVLSANGVEEDDMAVKSRTTDVRPWRISTDVPRASLDTVIAGVGYLLYASWPSIP